LFHHYNQNIREHILALFGSSLYICFTTNKLEIKNTGLKLIVKLRAPLIPMFISCIFNEYKLLYFFQSFFTSNAFKILLNKCPKSYNTTLLILFHMFFNLSENLQTNFLLCLWIRTLILIIKNHLATIGRHQRWKYKANFCYGTS